MCTNLIWGWSVKTENHMCTLLKQIRLELVHSHAQKHTWNMFLKVLMSPNNSSTEIFLGSKTKYSPRSLYCFSIFLCSSSSLSYCSWAVPTKMWRHGVKEHRTYCISLHFNKTKEIYDDKIYVWILNFFLYLIYNWIKRIWTSSPQTGPCHFEEGGRFPDLFLGSWSDGPSAQGSSELSLQELQGT